MRRIIVAVAIALSASSAQSQDIDSYMLRQQAPSAPAPSSPPQQYIDSMRGSACQLKA